MIRLFVTILTTLLLASAARAHSTAEATVPADGAVVASLDEVVLRFDEPMRVTVIGLEGESGSVDLRRVQGTEPVREFTARPEVEVAPGAYTVNWRGLSSDGHPMDGSFGFTVKE